MTMLVSTSKSVSCVGPVLRHAPERQARQHRKCLGGACCGKRTKCGKSLRAQRGETAASVSVSSLGKGKSNSLFLSERVRETTGKWSVRRLAKDKQVATWRLSASSNPAADSKEGSSGNAGGNLVTAGYIALWYAVNVCFNLTNKSLYKSFPFPWTVSTVHVIVGAIYCLVCYGLGFKKASFGRPITGEELKKISGPASMHAFGHIAANLSFAAVAISLTHTVKTLEPAFSAVLQWSILGTATPLPVLGSLVPIIFGVGMVCASELSFNWLGFLSAMFSNLTFGFRAVLSKKTMSDVKDLGSTALYAYTTVISVVLCAPLAIIMEGKALPAGIKAAVAKLGAAKFSAYLLAVGLFYHLYNQFAFNTLQRINPVSHGVCNVIKRIIIIGSSVVFFGNVLTTKTIIGTAIALAGTALYTELQSRHKHKQN